jgi:hypothetical protein
MIVMEYFYKVLHFQLRFNMNLDIFSVYYSYNFILLSFFFIETQKGKSTNFIKEIKN